VQYVFVDQALDCADRELQKLSGFAGAAASGGGDCGHACLQCKTLIYRQSTHFSLASKYIDFHLLELAAVAIVSLGTLWMFVLPRRD
jgi:hypothetical protein